MIDTPARASAPWIRAQTAQLLAQRGHAWLLQGPSGLGQYGLAMALARAWLCENADANGACDHCGSCHAIDVRTHADLCMLMPETTMLELGWPLSEKAQSDIDDKKRKASKEIRVDAMRDAVEFSQRTSARGRGKVVLVFPAEDMNAITANALLKTLEEPPGDVKFVLATQAAHQLLPTIRSRCIGHTMVWPEPQIAKQWLLACGIPESDANVLLAAAGGRPDDAMLYAQSGLNPTDWAQFPKAMGRGDVVFVKDWSAVQLIDGLHKLCHDMLAHKMGASPRFFAAKDLQPTAALAELTEWSRALARARRTMEHPFNAGLMLEALVAQAKTALNSTH
jgi:DNA polymerase III subunit delta'